MNRLVEKVLESGLIDKSAAELLERMGLLDEGASEKVDENKLKGATRLKLIEITESLAVEVEREHKIKETYLDLERLRWPVTITSIFNGSDCITGSFTGVIDRQGRYYFRVQDAKAEWFVPGYTLHREGQPSTKFETILESQMLYLEENPVALQVTTKIG